VPPSRSDLRTRLSSVAVGRECWLTTVRAAGVAPDPIVASSIGGARIDPAPGSVKDGALVSSGALCVPTRQMSRGADRIGSTVDGRDGCAW
jgi:hypothetical protein